MGWLAAGVQVAATTVKIATPAGLTNFMLSGIALIVSFNLNLQRARGK